MRREVRIEPQQPPRRNRLCAQRFLIHHRAALLAPLILLAAADLSAAEPEPAFKATFLDEAKRSVTVEGKLVVEAADGGFLLLGRDGRLWTVRPARLINRERLDRPFSMMTGDELARALTDEYGGRFEIVRTRHYVIASRTTPEYARWCGELFERLLSAFLDYWRSKGLELAEPRSPLPAVIFDDEQTFKAHAVADVGAFAGNSKGYYSVRSNRIVLYDLTAADRKRPANAADVRRRAAVASFNAATIVHEATHQIAFNSGLHTRFADNPLWLTEGMAMYFETVDLDEADAWRTIGRVNTMRRDRFLEFARRRRKRDSLATLVSQRDRLTNPRQATDAYAEAWALTDYLISARPGQYVAYLKRIAARQPLAWEDDDARLAEFTSVFGNDLKELDAALLRHVRSAPARAGVNDRSRIAPVR
jgi:hypothetical protein